MAAFKRMLQVGMKAEDCLLRYRVLKAHLTSSSSSSEELLKKMRSHPGDMAADIHDDWERRMAEFRKMMESDMAKHFATVEKINRERADYYKSLNEARKKRLRKVAIGFAVFINGFFVAAAMRESFQGVLGRSH